MQPAWKATCSGRRFRNISYTDVVIYCKLLKINANDPGKALIAYGLPFGKPANLSHEQLQLGIEARWVTTSSAIMAPPSLGLPHLPHLYLFTKP